MVGVVVEDEGAAAETQQVATVGVGQVVAVSTATRRRRGVAAGNVQ